MTNVFEPSSVQVAGSTLTAPVQKALRNAAAATGVDFQYLLQTAARESSFRPNLEASTSSATGLFQFIEQTWLQSVKNDGPRFGLQAEANAITRNADGRYRVDDPTQRQAILDLRRDADISAKLAGALTQRNSDYLARSIGRTPTDGELYVAHFLGANGAAQLIQSSSSNPNQYASDLFPAAAKSNKSIFYTKDGQARTVSQVYAQLTSKHQSDLHVPPFADPEQTLASHGQSENAEPRLDAAQAAFLAGHFGSGAAAFQSPNQSRDAFSQLFGRGQGQSGQSFFIPEQGAATPPRVRSDDNSTIPSRYGRLGDAPQTRPAQSQAPASAFIARPVETIPVSPEIEPQQEPIIITSSEFGKTDLPFDLGAFRKTSE